MPILSEGATAPNFTLHSDQGEKVSLSALQDKPLVLFFYPKDDTPGCTIECKEFRDARADFQAKAHVFGISPDDMASHQAFRDKYALTFHCFPTPSIRSPVYSVSGGRRRTAQRASTAPPS